MSKKLPSLNRKDGTSVPEISPDLLFSPSELYHENSKLHLSDRLRFAWIEYVNTSPDLHSIISRPFPHYRGYPSVVLPREFPPTQCSFEEVLTERRSVREYSGAPLSLSALAKILYLGDGVVQIRQQDDGIEWALRTAPSAGGLFPINLYCFALRVSELVAGLYFYNPARHCLVCLSEGDFTQPLIGATYLESPLSKACVCIAISAVFPQVKFKYGERAYRFALLEAGHIAQNLLLAAQAERLGAVPIGGFIDDQVNQLLKLDGVQEAVLYLVIIGSLG